MGSILGGFAKSTSTTEGSMLRMWAALGGGNAFANQATSSERVTQRCGRNTDWAARALSMFWLVMIASAFPPFNVFHLRDMNRLKRFWCTAC